MRDEAVKRGLLLTCGHVDALEVDSLEFRVVEVKLGFEGVALLAEDGVGLVDEHADVEEKRDGGYGHMRCRAVGRVHDERRVQIEPGDGHGDDHVERQRAHAVLGVCAALDEERRDGAGCQQDEAAVHGAV